jgi:hypothetical protein
MAELTLSVDDYIEKRADFETGAPEDVFTLARVAMRLVRSSEFKDLAEYLGRSHVGTRNVWMHAPASTAVLEELWRGVPLTPRVAAATRLVSTYLELFLNEEKLSSKIFPAILARFGRSFMFKPEVGDLLLLFLERIADPGVLHEYRSDLVAAILERLVGGFSGELVIHLVKLIGNLATQADPLFVRLLRYLVAGHVDLAPQLDIVYIKNGRIVQRPNHQHPLLDKLVADKVKCVVEPELLCVVISALTKIAAAFPQYRPQTVELFTANRHSLPVVAQERIAESLVLLHSFHNSRHLVALGA